MKITDKKYLSSGTLPKRALNTRFCPSYTTKDDFVRLFFVTATDLRQFFNCRQTMFATCTCAADTIGAYCATIAITLVSLATSPVIRTKKPLNSRCLAAFSFFDTARKIRILVAYEKGFGGKIRQRVRHRNYEKEQKGL